MEDSDPSLAFKLLRDELDRVREQIQAERSDRQDEQVHARASFMVTPAELYNLQEENARLRRELDNARARVAELPDGPKDVHDTEREESLKSQLKNTEGDAASLAEKVALAKEEYHRQKSSKRDKENSVSELQGQLDKLTTRLTEEQERLEVLRKEQEERNATAPFDPLRFLEDREYSGDAGSDTRAEVPITCLGSSFELPKFLRDLWVPDGHISKNLDEVLWSTVGSGSKSHCVCLSTTHRFNPKLHDRRGGWEPTWDMEDSNRGTRDFFYMKDKKWYYVGTYQWVGQAILPQRAIRTAIHPHMHYLHKRSIIFPSTLPPAIADIVRAMINGGVLKVACTGWRRVGFNTKLADALQAGQSSVAAINGRGDHPHPSNVVSVYKEGTREPGMKATKRITDSPQDEPKKKRKLAKS